MSSSGWRPRRPPVRVPLIERRSLLRSLDAILHEGGPQVALVSAPAGFGKTTIGDQFSEAAVGGGTAIGWADLGSRGGSPRGVWHTVLTAVEVGAPSAERSRPWPRAPRRPDDLFVRRLHDAMDDLAETLVLVLDDVESVDPIATRQLGEFVWRLPERVRVVLLSRHDPPFSLHELRLAGQLVELRAADLAFTPDETAEVLSGRGLDPEDIEATVRLTEGWPAGVQLAGALLKQPGDGARLSGLFNGQSAVLSDYLFNEAFTGQTARSQDLLLRTSVVPVLSDGLAAELTGRPDAGEAIAQMSDLAPLLSRNVEDASDELTYRYHPLLRAYLVGELARRDRDLLHSTHRRAAHWFERHADYLGAIRHALATEDADLLDDVAQRRGPGLVLAGESDALLHVLGESTVAPTPWASLVGACAAVRCANATTAAKWLALSASPGDATDARLSRLRESMVMKIAGLTGAPPPTIRGDSAAARENDDLELLCAVNRATALSGSRDSDMLEREAHDALNRALALGSEIAELQCRALLATAALGLADFVEAGARAATARNRCRDLGRVDDPSQGLSNAIAAWVAYEALDDAAVQRHIGAAMQYSGQGMDPSNRRTATRLVTLLNAVARRHPWPASNGEPWTSIDAAADLPTPLRAIACFSSMRTALDSGRPDGPHASIDEAVAQLGDSGDVATMRAMALGAQRHADAARKTLQPVIDGRLPCHSQVSLIEALLLEATYALEAHRSYDAFDCVLRALTAAQACGGYRPFLDAAAEVRSFLHEHIDRLEAHRDVIERVLASRPSPADGRAILSPLTAREFDILRELPTLNRLDEIAHDLLISTNTVKTHVRGIYRKLGVSSRRDAVAEARRLGII